ncbi:DnaJ domain-containing protein [Planktothrix agardhii 1033]|nr:DnaJ domain-containing protein [Planktothrix agardhii 1033]
MKSYYNFSQNLTTGTTFITVGGATGAGIYSTIGGVGLVGSFGGIGLGIMPLMGVGAVAGAATYGAFRALNQGDAIAWGAVGLGAISGVGISSVVGGMGLGFAGTGVGKRILDQEFYTAALLEVLELIPEFQEEKLNQKFNDLELDEELKNLKQNIQDPQKSSAQKNTEKPNIENHNLVIRPHSPDLLWTETQRLAGHQDSIHAVAFSPDGQTLISASDDRNIHIWDVNTIKKKYTWFMPYEMYSVAISPNSEIVATGSVNGRITLWNFQTRQLNRTLLDLNFPEKNMGIITSLVFSPDNQILISGSSDKTVRLWYFKTGQSKRILNGHTDGVWSVAICSKGQFVASGSADQTIRIWNIQTHKNPIILTGHSNWVTSGQFVASGSADQTIRIWNIQTHKNPIILTGHSNWVTSVLFTPDDQTLISASTDNTIKVWDWKNQQLIRTLTGHSAAIFSIALSPNSQILASGSVDKTVKLWNWKTGELLQTLSGCSPVAFSPDGQRLVSGSQKGILQLWYQQLGIPELIEFERYQNWWQVLGVHPQATPNQVKQAYYQLAKLYHPDHNIKSEAIAVMQRINHAYETFLNEWNQRVRSQSVKP